ncbi:Fructokinase [Collimonas arenae]|uniref:Fructokinase n=1 Tax=Collimonas arenae TaxID=279058 RepID=A0A0A1F8C7_9BURK|nr:carbohydrate kinase [Collimonas arenae]AIY39924.1 Fructokinase [Collimonas arenae]
MNFIPQTRLPQFVSAGDILTDLIRVDDLHWTAQAGGAGWNVARVVATLGVPSAFAGAIGFDHFSDELWTQSERAGLDLRFLQRYSQPPLLAVVSETDPPDYFFIGSDSADLAFDPEHLPAGWMQQARWAHFGCISLVRQPLADKLIALAATLKASGVRISYDPNHRKLMDEHYLPTLEKMMALADIVKISDQDLQAFFPELDTATAIARLQQMQPGATILFTRGSAGACLLQDGVEIAVSLPPKVAVRDTVGAGDASIGGLLFSLMHHTHRSWAEHLGFAVAVAAASCRQQGAYAPTLDEVEQLLILNLSNVSTECFY